MKRLYAEWERQSGIFMAFPHENSDWKEIIQEARECFCNIIATILRFEPVLLCIDIKDDNGFKLISKKFQNDIKSKNLVIVRIRTNDTWARDFMGISVESSKGITMLDFGFNGWGLKFGANFDNKITRKLYKLSKKNDDIKSILDIKKLKTIGLILEGGSIESNGNGVLLTNTQCLLEKNRNPHLSKKQIESKLKKYFRLKQVLWLDSGFLAGDDTDSHIDMLARFIAKDTIAYTKCYDKNDIHYKELNKMEQELKKLKIPNNKPYKLVPLPLPLPIYAESSLDSKRLPASYANFLFVNGALLVPTYSSELDKVALEALQNALPHLEIVGVPCLSLIKWHGSLHCATMQIFKAH